VKEGELTAGLLSRKKKRREGKEEQEKNKWSASEGNLGPARATAPNCPASHLTGQFSPGGIFW